jgi:hypothetical protein
MKVYAGCPLDLTNPTTHFYHTRERVRDCIERDFNLFQRDTYKKVAHKLKIDPRTVTRHIRAIRNEHLARA